MLLHEIKNNYRHDWIVPYFQPIVDLRNSRVWRYECLARLVTPQDKVYMPNEFLQFLDRENEIHQLTESMFGQCARYFENMNIPWNINLDAKDISNADLIRHLASRIKNYPNPQRISLEVDATTALNQFETLKAFINDLAPTGIGVFVDNLGKTSGNVKRLMSLPLRGIKLDGGLIRHLEDECAVKDFILNICDMAKQRHIDVVAEHVADEATLEKVSALPINYAQGFIFSMPKNETVHH